MIQDLMTKLNMAKRIVSNVQDFDMENLIPPMNYMENLDDASKGRFEVLPRKTIRDRGHGQGPLFIKPDYSGDFLEKLKQPIQPGRVIETADETNLWDFSSPEEMLKHQEQPYPRNTLDEFYDINRPGEPGEGGGADTLKDFWDRSWDVEDAPEISEDKWLRPQQRGCPKTQQTYKMPFRSARRVIASFMADQLVDTAPGPSPSVVVAHYLMDRFPIQAWMDSGTNVRVAKLIRDLEKPMIKTQTRDMKKNKRNKGYHNLNLPGVSVRLKKAEPQLGRWTFTTGSGHKNYTTVFQFIPNGNITDPSKLHVRVSCDCPSFLYWGAQFNAYMGDYLYGTIRPKMTKPVKRDPEGKFLICKHILATIPIVSHYHLGGIPTEVKERLQRPLEVKVKPTQEKLHIPEGLKNFARQPDIQGIIRKWPGMSPLKRKEFIMNLDSPGAIAFFAHRFPNTATKYVAEKLKDMAVHHKIPSMRKWAKDLLRTLPMWDTGAELVPMPETEKEPVAPSEAPTMTELTPTPPGISPEPTIEPEEKNPIKKWFKTLEKGPEHRGIYSSK